jgi:hypothetical protein
MANTLIDLKSRIEGDFCLEYRTIIKRVKVAIPKVRFPGIPKTAGVASRVAEGIFAS